VPEICQKLRYAQPHAAPPRNPLPAGGLDKSMTSGSNRQVREPEPDGLVSGVMTSAAQRDQRPPRRLVSSRVMIAAGLAVLLAAATIVVARADLWERPGTAPARGRARTARPPPGRCRAFRCEVASGLRIW
jgi:hypothetical protein